MEQVEGDFEPITGDGQPVAEQPFYSRSQLALRNGQDRDEIWVAFRGLIYDVSRSRLWKRGNHYEHWAGQDLTPEMAEAPHTANVLDRFPVIGRLAYAGDSGTAFRP